MAGNNFEQVKDFARSKGYKEIVINVNQKKPIIIEGIKGRFIPEVLCYSKGKLKALITLIKSILDEQEFHKFTLFMDYCKKNHLQLYVMYNEQQFSKDEIVNTLTQLGITVPKDLTFIAIK